MSSYYLALFVGNTKNEDKSTLERYIKTMNLKFRNEIVLLNTDKNYQSEFYKKNLLYGNPEIPNTIDFYEGELEEVSTKTFYTKFQYVFVIKLKECDDILKVINEANHISISYQNMLINYGKGDNTQNLAKIDVSHVRDGFIVSYVEGP